MSKRFVWAAAVLVAGYIMLQMVADVAAAKIAQIGALTLPAGTFVYAITFTWRDLIHKKLGRDWARAAIVAAAGCNVVMVLYFQLAIWLKPAGFWPLQEAYAATLGVVWRIAIGSILAELVSELVDTELYHLLAPRFGGWKQWVRVLGSNAVSLPLDSLVFTLAAFAGTMPLVAILAVAWGQIVFKGLVTLISLPGIYLVKESKPI
jgi:queuosine precursor transporter